MLADLSLERRGHLFNREIQLAKAELAEKASRMGKGAAMIVGGVSWPQVAFSRLSPRLSLP